MRVVAGDLRGRRIEAPPGVDTRPTTDKVREAVFNALGSLDLVRDALVVDLYAGSGALGIEALSRGAVLEETDTGVADTHHPMRPKGYLWSRICRKLSSAECAMETRTPTSRSWTTTLARLSVTSED